MVDLRASRAAIELQGAAVADGLRNLMLLVRQLREEGFDVKPEGLGVIEGLLFAETHLLDDFCDQVRGVLTANQALEKQAGHLAKAILATDADIAELVQSIRKCLDLLAISPSGPEGHAIRTLIGTALAAIERRLAVERPQEYPSNVVPFAPVASPAKTGGVT